MKNNTRLKQFILLAGDILILYGSLYLALTARYLGWVAPATWNAHLAPFSAVFLIWILVFYISGLYDLHSAINNPQFYRRSVNSLAVSAIISLAFFYLIPRIGIAPKTNLLIFILIFSFFFLAWRRAFNWLLKSYLPKRNIIIVGINKQVLELVEEFNKKPHLGFQITAVFDEEGGNIPGARILNDIKSLPAAIRAEKISSIVLAGSLHESPDLRAALFECLPLGLTFVGLSGFYEAITGRVPIETIGQTWFLENLNEGDKGLFDSAKRLFDIAMALVILILSISFWPLIGLIIKLESRGPVFFKQSRAGKNNKPFTIYKFRTMTVADNDASPTVKDDARVTRFGSFLRKTRLDELPQVINILKGEMSFVGPRPERVDYIAPLGERIPFYNERMLVKPGVTGWDQISGEYHSPSLEDTLKKLQYDLFYIKNRSIYLDLSIILKTISTVISRSGR